MVLGNDFWEFFRVWGYELSSFVEYPILVLSALRDLYSLVSSDLDGLSNFLVVVLGLNRSDFGAYPVSEYNKSFDFYWFFAGSSC